MAQYKGLILSGLYNRPITILEFREVMYDPLRSRGSRLRVLQVLLLLEFISNFFGKLPNMILEYFRVLYNIFNKSALIII